MTVALTHRRVLTLALPMTLSHATTPLLGLVGAAVIGRLGDPALLGAMALGAVMFSFIFWTFGSLRMATAGLTAQAVGAADPAEVDRTLLRALMAAGVVGLVLIALERPIGALAFKLAGASPAVTHALRDYYHVRIFSAPFTLANYAILGSILGRGRTDLGLLLQVLINLANIGLTVGFVVGWHEGVAGAAWATLLAEAAGTLFGFGLLSRLGTRFGSVPLRDVMRRAAMLHMLAVNRDVMIRTAVLMLAVALFTGIGARSGDVTLASNAVLENMMLIGSYALDGFATAAETLCGQALGAGDRHRFRRAIHLALVWSCGCGLAISALSFAGGSRFIDFVTTSQDVRGAAHEYLVYAALVPVLGAPAYAFDGIFIGATWTVAMRNLMLAAFFAYALVLFGLRGWGNAGLWLAYLVFVTTRGLGQAIMCPRLIRQTFG